MIIDFRGKTLEQVCNIASIAIANNKELIERVRRINPDEEYNIRLVLDENYKILIYNIIYSIEERQSEIKNLA